MIEAASWKEICCVPGLIYRFLVVIKSCETSIPQGYEEI
jgi:hypothetical protein